MAQYIKEQFDVDINPASMFVIIHVAKEKSNISRHVRYTREAHTRIQTSIIVCIARDHAVQSHQGRSEQKDRA